MCVSSPQDTSRLNDAGGRQTGHRVTQTAITYDSKDTQESLAKEKPRGAKPRESRESSPDSSSGGITLDGPASSQ